MNANLNSSKICIKSWQNIADKFYKSVLKVDKVIRLNNNDTDLSDYNKYLEVVKSSNLMILFENFFNIQSTNIYISPIINVPNKKNKSNPISSFYVYFFLEKVYIIDRERLDKFYFTFLEKYICSKGLKYPNEKHNINNSLLSQRVTIFDQVWDLGLTYKINKLIGITFPIELLQKFALDIKYYTIFKNHINEDFLHYIWKNRLFNSKNQLTSENEKIEFVDVGSHNFNSGPDFFNAKLKIANTLWNGNVELHLKSSDWNLHKHIDDEAYNNVILHVVKQHNKDVYTNNKRKIPTLELDYPKKFECNYKTLLESDKTIPCANFVKYVNKSKLFLLINRFTIERLERKTDEVYSIFNNSNKNWKYTFLILLARSFGMKVNSDAFEILFKSFNVNIISKNSDNILLIEALLYGQSGLLSVNNTTKYYLELLNNYKFLKNKYNLEPINVKVWKYMRIRPNNFPTIRISQLASFLSNNQNISSQFIDEQIPYPYILKLFDIDANDYWDDNYTFKKVANQKLKKILGKTFVNNIIINAVVSYVFAYGKYNNNQELMDYAIDLLENIPAEKNYLTRIWNNLDVKFKNSYQTQGFIQLTTEYCNHHNCIKCPVGALYCKQ